MPTILEEKTLWMKLKVKLGENSCTKSEGWTTLSTSYSQTMALHQIPNIVKWLGDINNNNPIATRLAFLEFLRFDFFCLEFKFVARFDNEFTNFILFYTATSNFVERIFHCEYFQNENNFSKLFLIFSTILKQSELLHYSHILYID